MFNRAPYNRTPYNRSSMLEFQWMATVNGVAEAQANITLSLVLSANAATGETETSAALVLVVLPTGKIVEARATAIATYIRTIFFKALAEAKAEARGTKVSIYEIVTMAINDINMSAGDILVIDTAQMIVTLNGVSIVDKISDSSAFFDLKPGLNEVTVTGESAADIKILWKDKWL